MLFHKIPSISTEELQKLIMNNKNINIIDVREPFEFKSGHIANAQNIPLEQISKINNVNKKFYIICQTGNRSKMATKFLLKNGINAINVRGGMLNWNGPIV